MVFGAEHRADFDLRSSQGCYQVVWLVCDNWQAASRSPNSHGQKQEHQGSAHPNSEVWEVSCGVCPHISGVCHCKYMTGKWSPVSVGFSCVGYHSSWLLSDLEKCFWFFFSGFKALTVLLYIQVVSFYSVTCIFILSHSVLGVGRPGPAVAYIVHDLSTQMRKFVLTPQNNTLPS